MNKLFLSTLCSGALLFATAGCDVEQTRDGRLPDVDVDVSGDPGQLPAYDVDAPDVDVEMEDKNITLPDVDVDIDSQEATIPVPDVDVELPRDDE